jgi:RNA-directed DNA polymerase
MKSTSALHAISDLQALKTAWRAISKRNKLSRGSDKVTIKTFSSNLDSNLRAISSDLRLKKYEFSKLRPAMIAKPGSDKPRPIQVPAIRDRVVMKALALHIRPSFARFDLSCSYAFIPGKDRGVKAAIAQIKDLVDQGYIHYFEADIKNFFGAVERPKLWKMFSKQVRERSLLPLLEKCFNLELDDLESYQTEHQDIFLGATVGIPQGGVLSPMLANYYLYEFDKTITANGFRLIRYADDFVVMCETREDAERAHILCRAILKDLGLEIHALDEPKSKSRFGNFSKDGLSFLGVRFEGQITHPNSKVVKRFQEKITLVLRPSSGDSLSKTLQSLANLIKGWGMGYRDMRVTKLYGELDAFIKEEVVKYLKHSGVHLQGRNLGKQMRFLGVPSLSAMVSHSNGTKLKNS